MQAQIVFEDYSLGKEWCAWYAFILKGPALVETWDSFEGEQLHGKDTILFVKKYKICVNIKAMSHNEKCTIRLSFSPSLLLTYSLTHVGLFSLLSSSLIGPNSAFLYKGAARVRVTKLG